MKNLIFDPTSDLGEKSQAVKLRREPAARRIMGFMAEAGHDALPCSFWSQENGSALPLYLLPHLVQPIP